MNENSSVDLIGPERSQPCDADPSCSTLDRRLSSPLSPLQEEQKSTPSHASVAVVVVVAMAVKRLLDRRRSLSFIKGLAKCNLLIF